MNCNSQSIWIWSEPFIVTKMSKDKVSAVNLDNTFNAPSINSPGNIRRLLLCLAFAAFFVVVFNAGRELSSLEYSVSHGTQAGPITMPAEVGYSFAQGPG